MSEHIQNGRQKTSGNPTKRWRIATIKRKDTQNRADGLSRHVASTQVQSGPEPEKDRTDSKDRETL